MATAMLSDADKAFNLFRCERAMRYVGRTENLEPGKVLNLAAHAVMTEDRFLAAQILSRLGTLPKRARGLAFLLRRELEAVIVGGDTSDARELIAIARDRARGATAE